MFVMDTDCVLCEVSSDFFMEYITMCLDSTNEIEHWFVKHTKFYCLYAWALLFFTCSNLYTGHFQGLLYM
jgi:hypothetical protein